MRIGIDLGGTKIEGIALDENGHELMRHRCATPSGNYQATLRGIADLIQLIEGETRQTGSIGIGTPGSISQKTQLLRNSNSTCMNGKPVKQDLEKMLNRAIRISNDANCFALSEATDGAATDGAIVFGVIIGTGTGAGIIINGKLLPGSNAIAGEWGHNPIPWAREGESPGPDCYCGKQGCIESFLSGPGLCMDYQRSGGQRLTAIEIVALAQTGDMRAEACLQRYEDRLARGLAHIMNIIDPHVIVLGGGMSNIARLYQNVPKLWSKYVFSEDINTRLVAPMYGDSSGVRGAAWLWSL